METLRNIMGYTMCDDGHFCLTVCHQWIGSHSFILKLRSARSRKAYTFLTWSKAYINYLLRHHIASETTHAQHEERPDELFVDCFA